MCVYCHDLNRSHVINDETKKKKFKAFVMVVGIFEAEVRCGDYFGEGCWRL